MSSHPHFQINRSLLLTAERTGRLDLHGLGLSSFPSSLFHSPSLLSSIHSLDLSQNKFHNLPSSISEFLCLRELYLDGNPLKNLPNEIGNLKNLRWIALNEMEYLEDNLKNLYQKSQKHSRNRTRDAALVLGYLRTQNPASAGPEHSNSASRPAPEEDSLSKYMRENTTPSSQPSSRMDGVSSNPGLAAALESAREDEQQKKGKRRSETGAKHRSSSIFGDDEPGQDHRGKRMGGFDNFTQGPAHAQDAGQPVSAAIQHLRQSSRFHHTPALAGAAPYAAEAENLDKQSHPTQPTAGDDWRPARRQHPSRQGKPAPFGVGPNVSKMMSAQAEAHEQVMAARAGEIAGKKAAANLALLSSSPSSLSSSQPGESSPSAATAYNRGYFGSKPVSEMSDEEVKELAKRLMDEEHYLQEIENKHHAPHELQHQAKPVFSLPQHHHDPHSDAELPAQRNDGPAAAHSPMSNRSIYGGAPDAVPSAIRPAGIIRNVASGKKLVSNDGVHPALSQIFLPDPESSQRGGKRMHANKTNARPAPYGRNEGKLLSEEDRVEEKEELDRLHAMRKRAPFGTEDDVARNGVADRKMYEERPVLSQVFGGVANEKVRRGKGRGMPLIPG